ncbi:MAG: hypothetical protein INR65_19110 [Gluconacetobacter diazotrophicus]|nr:hypothetical protein [Gluconacetobacter diazotrophicus]
MLAEIGRDCVGALQFPPEITGMPLDDAQIGTMLRNLARGPLGLDEEDDFRISVADAQETTPLLRHEGRWLKPTGTTP